jgi:hypothetical protein
MTDLRRKFGARFGLLDLHRDVTALLAEPVHLLHDDKIRRRGSGEKQQEKQTASHLHGEKLASSWDGEKWKKSPDIGPPLKSFGPAGANA